jgi:uncharacterized membrane protein
MEGPVMGEFKISTTINRPLEEVFAVVSRIENNPKWSSVVLNAEQTSPGPPGIGTTAKTTGKFLGKRIETGLEITEFEPNRKFAYRSTSGPISRWGVVTFDAIDGGTRVSVRVGGEPAGFFKLAEPLVISMSKRQLQSDLDNLKDLMEARAL